MMSPSRFLSLPLNSRPLFPFYQTTLNSLAKPIKIPSCAAMSFLQKQKFFAPFFGYSPLSGLEDDVVDYVFGKKKATEVAHLVWKHIVRKGDTVVDATCGNGYDTLTMLKMVADESGRGRVYGLDIQGEALESTSSLLDETVNQEEKGLVKLFNICHSRMEEVVAKNAPVRLVAFNLGYLPGGNKTVITVAETTLLALEAAERIVIQGGLVSIVVYVGHPGGSVYGTFKVIDHGMAGTFPLFNR